MASGSDGAIYLGTADGHIFASTDGARHWELRGRTTTQQNGRIDAVVQRLIVDSRAPRRLFAAIWFQDPAAGGGIYRSEDAGRTWSLAGLPGEPVRALEQSPSHPEIFVAGTRSGVFRSTDFGRSWERISPAGDPELRNLDSLAIDPRDPSVIYAGTYHLPWKTVDAGKTWAPVAAGMIDDSDIMSLRIDLTNPARIFASACSGIYRSENSAAQWTKLEGVPYAARRTQAIVQDPADPRVLYAGTTEGLWITRDAGETWTRTTPRDWAINGVVVLPPSNGNRARVVLGTENQGVQVSDDAGVHFVASNAGFSHRVVAAFAVHPSQPGRWLARMAEPGADAILETRDAGQTWKPLPGAVVVGETAQFFGTTAGWFAAPSDGGLLRFDDAKQTWRRLRFAVSSLPDTAPPRASKARAQKRKTNPPLREEQVVVRDLRFANAVIFVASEQGVWTGELTAAALRPARPPIPLPPVLSLDFVPGSLAPSEGWLVTRANLFHSQDAGKSWQPEPPPADAAALRWVRSVPGASNSGLLLGAANGVFWRPRGMREWRQLGAGLPSAETLPPANLEPAAWLLAAKAGGLYLSRDAATSWTRLDGPLETSFFLGAAPDGAGGVIAGSRSEGILRWNPNK
jgi:photosystem II stability/assembly factor-like uncharacterized protein